MSKRPQPQNGQDDQVLAAFASTDCPSCGGFVPLAGSGKKGQTVKLTGACPNGHSVFFIHTIS